MWREKQITGAALPKGQLCLTFDDGPAVPQTLQFAEFLSAESIPATFFVVGAQARRHPAVLLRLLALGHAIGNHTLTHPHLTASSMRDEQVREEIASTDRIVAGAVPSAARFFRPPYGAWNRRLAQILNRTPPLAQSHIGPVGWDFGGQDHVFWRERRSPEACADAYFRQIEKQFKRGGIVLFHDYTADDLAVAERNRTPELIRILIPRLRDRGFSFVPLQSIPGIGAETL